MTVEIPEELFRRAKIRAVERGATMRELVMGALESELSASSVAEEGVPYFANRKLDPEFRRMADEGGLRGGQDHASILLLC